MQISLVIVFLLPSVITAFTCYLPEECKIEYDDDPRNFNKREVPQYVIEEEVEEPCLPVIVEEDCYRPEEQPEIILLSGQEEGTHNPEYKKAATCGKYKSLEQCGKFAWNHEKNPELVLKNGVEKEKPNHAKNVYWTVDNMPSSDTVETLPEVHLKEVDIALEPVASNNSQNNKNECEAPKNVLRGELAPIEQSELTEETRGIKTVELEEKYLEEPNSKMKEVILETIVQENSAGKKKTTGSDDKKKNIVAEIAATEMSISDDRDVTVCEEVLATEAPAKP